MWCVLSLDKSVSFARAVEELAGGKKKKQNPCSQFLGREADPLLTQ